MSKTTARFPRPAQTDRPSHPIGPQNRDVDSRPFPSDAHVAMPPPTHVVLGEKAGVYAHAGDRVPADDVGSPVEAASQFELISELVGSLWRDSSGPRPVRTQFPPQTLKSVMANQSLMAANEESPPPWAVNLPPRSSTPTPVSVPGARVPPISVAIPLEPPDAYGPSAGPTVDDDGTLSTEARYMAMNMTYDNGTQTSMSGNLSKAGGALFVIGIIAIVAKILLTPETGGAVWLAPI